MNINHRTVMGPDHSSSAGVKGAYINPQSFITERKVKI